MKHMREMTPDCTFYWSPYEIKTNYALSLAILLGECAVRKVKIEKIGMLQGGFIVTFKGHKNADAILHDNSYAHTDSEWETMGFPWDEGDVSVHDAKTLAQLIHDLDSPTP